MSNNKLNDSFADRHPWLSGVILAGFIIIGGIPAVAMIAPTFACYIGATDTWCKPPLPPKPE